MDKAQTVGTVSLDLLKLPNGVKNWEKYSTEDIFATGLITIPNDYLLTLGSGTNFLGGKTFESLATTPAYPLRTHAQLYVAGRDVIRWGGVNDPYEIDFDRYIFTPVIDRGIAVVSVAPKSEPHHLSDVPELIEIVPDAWKEIFEAVRKGEFA